jgi:hypothetical protein
MIGYVAEVVKIRMEVVNSFNCVWPIRGMVVHILTATMTFVRPVLL